MVTSDGITNSRPNRSRHSLAGDTETRTDKRPGCQLFISRRQLTLMLFPDMLGYVYGLGTGARKKRCAARAQPA